MDCRGNLLFDRLMGSKIILVPPLSYDKGQIYGMEMKGLEQKMFNYKKKLE